MGMPLEVWKINTGLDVRKDYGEGSLERHFDSGERHS